MGTVYLVIARGPAGWSKLKVVKQMHPDVENDERRLKMFLDEARLSARLNHPNIVQTNEVGFDGEQHFIEMEYLEGQSLSAIVREAQSTGGIPLPLGLFILAQVLIGLHYAHELRDLEGRPLYVVHRDVSPHNVFVTYEGAVKVLDFGIAKAVDSSSRTEAGAMIGKLHYMAPEQVLAGRYLPGEGALPGERVVDRRADIFAVGILLWQVLTGKRLWADRTDLDIAARVATGDIPWPSTVEPGVDKGLEAICMKALALEPRDRFATASDFAVALEVVLRGRDEHVGARQVGELMLRLFGVQREKRQALIEARIKSVSADPGSSPNAVDAQSDPRYLRATPESAPSSTPESAPSSAPAAPADGTGSDTRTVAEVPRARRSGAEPAGDTGSATKPGPSTPPVANRRRWVAALVPIALVALASALFAQRAGRSAAVDPRTAAPRCKTNAECVDAHQGAPFLCRKDTGACVALASADCVVRAEPADARNDDTIWLGTLFPTTGVDAAAFGVRYAEAAELARRDFATVSHGIPTATDGRARPLGLIMCDDAVAHERAARHLALDLHVPGIVGFHSSRDLIDSAQSLFIPNDVVAVTALNHSDLVTAIPQPPGTPRMVWRATTSVSHDVGAMAAIVGSLAEPRLRSSAAVTGPIRVALLRADSTVGLSVSDALVRTLRFNGKTAVENGANYRDIGYGDIQSREARPQLDAAVTKLLEFKPHVVAWVADEAVIKAILLPLEERWPKGLRHRPFHVVLGPPAIGVILDFVGRDAQRRKRFLRINTPTTTIASTLFTTHFNEAFQDKVSTSDAPRPAYDAVYVLAYAAYAAGDAPLTGQSLAKGIARLVGPGPAIEVGPAKIFSAFSALRAGQNVDLVGTETRLHFDLATGEAEVDSVVQCIKTDGRGNAVDSVDSGMVYRAATKTLEGTFSCP